MSGVYSMSGPTYRGMSRQELFDSAMDQPLSLTSTLLEQAKGGALESFGLGTAIRESQLPEAAPTEEGVVVGPEGSQTVVPDTPTLRRRAAAFGELANIRPETAPELEQRRADVGALNEDQYKASPYFRKDIPYDPGMTETRAAALASMDDAKKVRQFYAQKRPFAAFIGNLAGQAFDPINYVPVAGPLVKAAAVAKAGRIGGAALHASLDAAANTAVFGIATAGERAKFGDDVSWQATVSQIATAALIGSAFGALSGAVGSRVDARRVAEVERSVATLKATQEARIALNEGIDAVVRGEDIKLSPNATEPMARMASEIRTRTAPIDFAPESEIASFARDADIKAHPSYATAKAGDAEAASRLVVDLVKKEEIDTARQRFGPDAVYVPVRAEEAGGRNVIPAALARHYAAKTGAQVNDDIVQTSRAFQTGPRPLERMIARAAFDGRIEAGKRYVLVDDVTVSGGTLAELADHIRASGGEVAGVVTLANAGRSGKFAPAPAQISKIEGRFGNAIRELFGVEPAALTADEAAYILNFRDVDTLRNSIAKATRERAGRLAAKGIGTPLRGTAVDTTAARHDPFPDGIKQAEASIAKPDDAKALAAQYRVDPQTGSFAEEAEVAQLAAEGRLTAEDASTMAQAQSDFETGSAYAEALQAVSRCLI